jgi:hypothetical protein
VTDIQPYREPEDNESAAAGWYPVDDELRYWDGAQWTTHRRPFPPVPTASGVSYPQAPPLTTVVTDARPNGVEMTLAWVITVLTVGYMLPWAVAATRGKSNSWAVGLVNLLLGWTFVGWIVALVMACTAHQVVAMRHWPQAPRY